MRLPAPPAGGLPPDLAGLRVALAHDWLTGMRGGERVLELLCAQFPGAPIHTLICNPAAVTAAIRAHPIRTSWLQRVPRVMQYYRYGLPLFPAAMERFPPPAADLVISTSHCVAKALRTRPGTPHLCYCFTPMRYAWVFYTEYFGGHPLKKMLLQPLLWRLRRWDRRVAQRVTRFVAISEHVRQRIRACYGREADVVYPPINIDFFTPGATASEPFDLIVSALVPYKRLDLAVRAYGQLGFPLKIVGTGTEAGRLQALAGAHVEFLGWQPDPVIRDLYRRCRCLVFPGEEDFGLVPLEAQACGRPVVAYGRGGVRESVADGISGVFFDEQTEAALLDAVARCSQAAWDGAAIRRHAARFGPDRFWAGLATSIRASLADRPKT